TNTGAYTILTPRQQITPNPYALTTRGIFVDNAKNVGIGTKIPSHKLTVESFDNKSFRLIGPEIYGFGARLNFGDNDYAYIEEDLDDKLKLFGSVRTSIMGGNVGIGTLDPTKKLDIDFGDLIVQGPGSFDTAGEEGTLFLGSVHHYIKGVHGFGVKIGTYGNGDILSIRELSGKVGINTNDPQEKFHVIGTSRFDLGSGQVNLSTPGGWPGIIAYSPNGNRRDITFTDNEITISAGSDSSPPSSTNALRIFENGEVAVKVLIISGGSDLSEQFKINNENQKINPGQVVCIDPENPGELILSKKAYDRTVAGIVSGAGGVNPGMLMGQKGTLADGNNPVALTGRVYCLADATNGPIEPGDLMTTSNIPGHAMKVTDYTKAQGAILGKAMSKLQHGKGLVLILVSLQ
ncbi:MAG: hypothetical protein GY869_01810, partial [Planctomycetes bacterium]|nr:hypothetical protein [Planctomycetota bacterium]